MTSRKRPEGTRAPETAPAAPEHGPEPPTTAPDALRSPERGLSGWFGLFVRICVYFTAALCLEVFLSVVDRWLTSADE